MDADIDAELLATQVLAVMEACNCNGSSRLTRSRWSLPSAPSWTGSRHAPETTAQMRTARPVMCLTRAHIGRADERDDNGGYVLTAHPGEVAGAATRNNGLAAHRTGTAYHHDLSLDEPLSPKPRTLHRATGPDVQRPADHRSFMPGECPYLRTASSTRGGSISVSAENTSEIQPRVDEEAGRAGCNSCLRACPRGACPAYRDALAGDRVDVAGEGVHAPLPELVVRSPRRGPD